MLIRPPRRISVIVVQQLDDYFAAWNEPQTAQRRTLLQRSLTADVELVHPIWGRSHGIDARVAHIDNYQSALPDTTVVLASGLDSHNDLVRYGWDIVDQDGHRVMEGIDVVELADDGRLKRILLFHGQLPDA
jgi:SnoaL-like domain